jgi:cytochrome c5
MKKSVFLALLALITIAESCNFKSSSAVAEDAKAKVAQKATDYKAKFNDAQMLEGQKIFQGKCTKCHKLPNLDKVSAAKVLKVLPKMEYKARLKDDQIAKVEAWIYTHLKN